MFQGHVPLFLDDALGFVILTLFGSCYNTISYQITEEVTYV